MRKLKPQFCLNPAFPAWQQRALAARAKLLLDISLGKHPTKCFQVKVWQDFKKQFLMRPGGGKCAFCEGRYVAGAPDDAEHFRPKGAVTQSRGRVQHPGYYWLAYEWQNLLLACRNCNSGHTRDYTTGETHPGKLNEFPIAGPRISKPCDDCDSWWDELRAEAPILLHPYYDEPEVHFAAAAHGALIGLTERGRATIEICDLNRPDLMADREREDLRWRERLKRMIDEEEEVRWFSEDEPFSLYLNSRMQQRVKQMAAHVWPTG